MKSNTFILKCIYSIKFYEPNFNKNKPKNCKLLYLLYKVADFNSKNKKRGLIKMKFDVVIGNPPYQENNSQNGRQAKPLYDRFIDMGIKYTNRLLVFITNNTFLTNDSKKELRDRMIEAGLNKLYNYPISGDIFKGVGVSVCIFNIDRQQKSNKEFEYRRIENGVEQIKYNSTLNIGDIIAENQYELDIPRKIHSDKSMDSVILGDKTFGIASNGRIGFTGRGKFVDISHIEMPQSVILKHKMQGFEDTDYIAYEDVPKGAEYINKIKVICPHAITKTSLTAFDKAEILDVNYICTENWAVMGAFDNYDEAQNYIKYLKTKTLKFISYVYSSTGMTTLTKVLFSHIPMQDFISNSDIDWSQSIADIDKQLYKKYGLSQEEIDYIEKTIKPME